MEPADQYHSEKDAALLERAAEVLQRRFGRLTSGDLIDGLTGAALSLRTRTGDSPVIKPLALVAEIRRLRNGEQS
jgi:hypothetical protein